MPVKVRGMTYKPVVLEDLKDAVYFGQVRVFSDAQLSGSSALKAAIANGSLTTMDMSTSSREFRPLSVPNLTPTAVTPGLTQAAPAAQAEPTLMPKSKAPDEAPASPTQKSEAPPEPLGSTCQQEQALLQADQLAAVVKAVESVGRKLDAMVVTGPGVFAQASLPMESTRAQVGRAEDIYIPDIRVDDMSNHISLESRNLGQGGKVNSAIAALKGLQKKNINSNT